MFCKELLGAGATQIRKANYANQGMYFQAFSNLSIGLERIGKLCLTLDHFIVTNGEFPTEEHLKNKIGHDLMKLYKRSQKLITERRLKVKHQLLLDSPIHKNIIRILSKFAKGDRYSNFDFLVGGRQSNPAGDWYLKVDMELYNKHTTRRKKQTIQENSKTTGEIMSRLGMVWHTSEQGAEINSYADASHRTGVFEAVAPKRQLYVLQIIRYWVDILSELQYLSMHINHEAIPYFNEILGGFSNRDSYFRSRKIWNTI
ncbi:hypothetical protein SAMN02745962_04238 [Pseudomonas sp. LAIL14HWK12:I11]|nr:hypothetical protein SAMN02745962_04238 [Pseudomonas sp. LAIL14HWK12:I11]SMR78699.1 hypothetical protein SAMN05661028_03506 [Pseudomonas sp. LAIL14HWK12:I10]SOD06773.1 hypothetical protein SAMN05660296_04499 [Pseudomonas sp. LAIL14HWK12:I8]